MMKYKIKRENKPRLTTYGQYKARTVHQHTIDTRRLIEEVAAQSGISRGTVLAVITDLGKVVGRHLREGDRVRLDRWGMMKLEIESDAVERPELFRTDDHIRGVRLHFLPESSKGSPELYQDIGFERQP